VEKILEVEMDERRITYRKYHGCAVKVSLRFKASERMWFPM
jgi:hypothetical protein